MKTQVGWTVVCTEGHEWCFEHLGPAADADQETETPAAPMQPTCSTCDQPLGTETVGTYHPECDLYADGTGDYTVERVDDSPEYQRFIRALHG